MKYIKQAGFSKKLHKRFQETSNKNLKALSLKDINQILYFFWDEVSKLVQEGYRVIFDGWISIFTRPVKRSSFKSNEESARQLTYGHRLRFKPLEQLSSQSERIITKEEYDALQKTKK